MRSIIAIAVVASCALAESAAAAAQRKALCKFTVDGKTYLNGRCNFEADPDGSFRIWDKAHTVYVNVDGNTAEASWNKNPKSFHADSSLGTLTRKGACWVNATTEICARNVAINK
jgi:opacity protein-like surface antigen